MVEIENLSLSYENSDINGFGHAFYLWENLDENGVTKYLKKIFKCEVNKLKFICSMASRWNGTNGSGWGFYSKNYEKYISQDEVYNIIQSFDKNKLHEFTEIEQIKLASFVLNYQTNEMDHVNEQKAQKLVNRWKAGEVE